MEESQLKPTKFFDADKIDISSLPLFQTLEKVPYKQRMYMGTFYTFISIDWFEDKPNLLSNILEGIKLKKEDIKELLGLLEIPTEEEKISIPPLGKYLVGKKKIKLFFRTCWM